LFSNESTILESVHTSGEMIADFETACIALKVPR